MITTSYNKNDYLFNQLFKKFLNPQVFLEEKQVVSHFSKVLYIKFIKRIFFSKTKNIYRQ